MISFKAKIEIIGINPFVFIPAKHLKVLFLEAGKDKGAIPVNAFLNGENFKINLVKYAGFWRLYLNTPIRKKTNLAVGDRGTFEIEIDKNPKIEKMPTSLSTVFKQSPKARLSFEALAPSHQKEIKRYLNGLKTQAVIERNTEYIRQYLEGKKPAGLHAILRISKAGL